MEKSFKREVLFKNKGSRSTELNRRIVARQPTKIILVGLLAVMMGGLMILRHSMPRFLSRLMKRARFILLKTPQRYCSNRSIWENIARNSIFFEQKGFLSGLRFRKTSQQHKNNVLLCTVPTKTQIIWTNK